MSLKKYYVIFTVFFLFCNQPEQLQLEISNSSIELQYSPTVVNNKENCSSDYLQIAVMNICYNEHQVLLSQKVDSQIFIEINYENAAMFHFFSSLDFQTSNNTTSFAKDLQYIEDDLQFTFKKSNHEIEKFISNSEDIVWLSGKQSMFSEKILNTINSNTNNINHILYLSKQSLLTTTSKVEKFKRTPRKITANLGPLQIICNQKECLFIFMSDNSHSNQERNFLIKTKYTKTIAQFIQNQEKQSSKIILHGSGFTGTKEVAINELLWMGVVTEKGVKINNAEFIEIMNLTSKTLPIGGFQISCSNATKQTIISIPAGIELEPKAYMVLYNHDIFDYTNGLKVDFTLNNNFNKCQINDSTKGVVLDSFILKDNSFNTFEKDPLKSTGLNISGSETIRKSMERNQFGNSSEWYSNTYAVSQNTLLPEELQSFTFASPGGPNSLPDYKVNLIYIESTKIYLDIKPVVNLPILYATFCKADSSCTNIDFLKNKFDAKYTSLAQLSSEEFQISIDDLNINQNINVVENLRANDLVISEIGANYLADIYCDYIEIYNPTDVNIELVQYSIQRGTAAPGTVTVFELPYMVLPSKSSYRIVDNRCLAMNADLWVNRLVINSDDSIFLVSNREKVSLCNQNSIIDLVSYGTNFCSSQPAENLVAKSALVRKKNIFSTLEEMKSEIDKALKTGSNRSDLVLIRNRNKE